MVSQNRNQYVTAMMLLAVSVLPHTETIEQKFLETGHTQMEVDAKHSTTDHHRKHLSINSPYEWPLALQTHGEAGELVCRFLTAHQHIKGYSVPVSYTHLTLPTNREV